MKSTPLIIDEWVIHDLRDDNGPERQKEALSFLEQVKEKCDRLVTLEGGPWMKKAFDLMEKSGFDLKLRQLSKILQGSIIADPVKFSRLQPDQIVKLPEELNAVVPPDDRYLIQLHKAVPGSIIVASEQKLPEKLSNFREIAVRFRDDFLREYLKV
jgi:hypothetical protein